NIFTLKSYDKKIAIHTKNSLTLKLNIRKKIHPKGEYGSTIKSSRNTTKIFESNEKNIARV
ncbi:MAG: hypothetical protein ACFFDK_18495, partial [Promethearchaeota archaeon]